MTNLLSTLFLVLLALTFVYLLVGTFLDVQAFDETTGGFSAPYTDWSGTPVDWTLLERTNHGVVKRGYVVDVFIDMTTGMISFGVGGLRYDWRTFSDRALVVHKPREAALALGFEPQF